VVTPPGGAVRGGAVQLAIDQLAMHVLLELVNILCRPGGWPFSEVS
jgi:hypothetical protein